MECKVHPGQEADLTCLKCGQPFCRECVKETREPNYCPDCHKGEVERLAGQMGLRKEEKPPKVKKEKEPKPPKPVKEPALKKEKKEKEEKKTLRRPLEKPSAPPAPVLKQQAEPVKPPSSMSEEEKAKFWGREDESEPMPVIPATKKRAIPSEGDREKAVMASEGFPTGERAKAKPAEKDEALDLPESRMARRRKRRGDRLVAMQLPEDYDGEVTNDPSYLKAVLWGLLIGFIGSAIFAGIAWWRPSGVSGIFGWFIGLAVGVAVVIGSGRHFNWKLGLIACAIALVMLAVGQILANVLFHFFPTDMYKFFWGFQSAGSKLTESVTSFPSQFTYKLWWLIFALSGATAFLVSFRPWGLRINVSRSPAPSGRDASRRRA